MLAQLTRVNDSSRLWRLCCRSNRPLPHLIRARRKERYQIESLAHSDDDLG
jgi:hypothetical protein